MKIMELLFEEEEYRGVVLLVVGDGGMEGVGVSTELFEERLVGQGACCVGGFGRGGLGVGAFGTGKKWLQGGGRDKGEEGAGAGLEGGAWGWPVRGRGSSATSATDGAGQGGWCQAPGT